MTDDLDSLLQIDDSDLVESTNTGPAATDTGADGDKKKKRRRRKKKGAGDASSEGDDNSDELSADDAGESSATSVDDLDALLSME